MQLRPYILPALVLVALVRPAFAAEQTLTLDAAASNASFVLDATGHKVHGKLAVVAGTITFDAASGEASGKIEIDARRTETGNKGRDKTMHAEVLESAGHPWIVFEPSRLEGSLAASGTSQVSLVGKVTLLGVEHPLTLPASVTLDGGQAKAKASFSVPYVEWGLHDPSLMLLRVAKSVDVTVEVVGSLDPTSAGQPAGQP